ncbi:transcriptional regulator, RpiR family [Meinhardsimonia xiamenensis]|uniref:Transcriptional regulator, RpiR family n=1 Tax=Meinhardsimonia xiamenensis TaxID=990712 RepID=A0A1G9ANT1_9RHOB|nr:MurR/RpiR family transcriptional regulator [Meinhardsimonia xiamenensis]PRX35305.1 RpiR family transcriptional regulator [Meinhardsimonia xiamenensis]SDK28927.1 transcriptional regulator, RpiR family [Meinhardsimonia xiamenensis]
MAEHDTIRDKIASQYAELSDRLKVAADYVAEHPLDVATRSLRSLSAASGVSPATFSRLARALGFSSYEEMRELSRRAVGNRALSFSERAGLLRAEARAGGGPVSMLERQAAACIRNIAELEHNTDRRRLTQAVDLLHAARNVVLFGAFSSTGVVEYMAYLANYIAPNWTLAGRMGASLGAALADLGAEDALLVVTKTPYARRAVVACEMARSDGAQVILITDSHACPAIPHANVHFLVPTESPQFFSSYAATVVLIETIIAMLVARSEADPSERIRQVEQRNRGLGEFWPG